MSIEPYAQEALRHIRFLSEEIGGRGSCTRQARQAAEYLAEQLKQSGLQGVQIESFQGSASTYRPYALAFFTGLAAALIGLFFSARWAWATACLVSLLAAWGMFRELDIRPNWLRWLLPKGTGSNTVGEIACKGTAIRRVVLCAHLDSHRTPVFYSSTGWQRLFSTLVGLTFLSLASGVFFYGVSAIFGLTWVRWFSALIIPIILFALSMCLHADLTSFSPGAGDNASGIGVTMSLVMRLALQPLHHTEVHLAFTDCEEVGAYGMNAYLDAHAAELGDQTVYMILDQVGAGKIKYMSSDGILVKHKTHPQALSLAQQAAQDFPEFDVREEVGIAYTDALAATQRGLIALSLDSYFPEASNEVSHWHQMSDNLESINPQSLSDQHAFAWHILQLIDQTAAELSPANAQ
jgi:hypothetical protein